MALLQRGIVVADVRRGGYRVNRTLAHSRRTQFRLANPFVGFLLLVLGCWASALAQQQPAEQKQQTKQDQRLLYQHVYRHDQERTLEDPAITNQVTYEQVVPDSSEQNVESRELTLDDLRRSRFVPAPVAGEGMQFVPGRGYVAGRTEEATEPGMSVLTPTLGFQTSGGLSSGQNSTDESQFQTMNPGDNASASQAGVNPYAQPADPLLGLDPFQANRMTGIGSALERRPPLNLPSARPSLWQNALTEPSSLTPVGKLPAESAPVRRAGMGRANPTGEFKTDPTTIHDRVELKRLSREGCLTRPISSHRGKTSEGRD